MLAAVGQEAEVIETTTDDDLDRSQYSHTNAPAPAQVFRPERGAFIPFRDGARARLGRRIVKSEVAAVLVVLFRSYS